MEARLGEGSQGTFQNASSGHISEVAFDQYPSILTEYATDMGDLGFKYPGTATATVQSLISMRLQEDECHAQLLVFYPNGQPVPYKLHCGEILVMTP